MARELLVVLGGAQTAVVAVRWALGVVTSLGAAGLPLVVGVAVMAVIASVLIALLALLWRPPSARRRSGQAARAGGLQYMPLVVFGCVLVTVAVLAALTLGGSQLRPAGAARAGPFFWNVRAGQTYQQIADKTGLTIAQLQALNPNVDPLQIVPGQKIKLRADAPVPKPKPKVQRGPGPRTWTVRRGQTFFSIATKTGHTTFFLQELNPKLDPNALRPGQVIKLRR